MELRITHWINRDGTSAQSINVDVVKNQRRITVKDPAVISGLIAAPYGWSHDTGDTIIQIERRDTQQWASLGGTRKLRQDKRESRDWTFIDADEINDKYLSFFLLDDGVEHENGDLSITYEDTTRYYRGVDDHFMEGLRYFKDYIDDSVKYNVENIGILQ